MHSRKPGDETPARLSGQPHAPKRDGNAWAGVVGNKRLSVLTSAVLLVLIVGELVTSVILNVGFAVHVFVGVGRSSPLVVKLGSTFYRFLRYYTKAPAYVRRGPPHLTLRVLGPVLIATTLVMVAVGSDWSCSVPSNLSS
jgi:hypothetical protein